MKRILAAISSFLAFSLAVSAHAAPPTTTTQTLRSENGSVNIETGAGAGDINFAVNNTRAAQIAGATGAMTVTGAFSTTGTHTFTTLTQDPTNGGNITLQKAGTQITVKGGGAAATAGTFTCNGVTAVTVTTTAASVSMVLAFSPNSISGTAPIGAPYVSALTPATSFQVKCSIAGETSVYNWALIGTS
jgi:hypothetical protein